MYMFWFPYLFMSATILFPSTTFFVFLFLSTMFLSIRKVPFPAATSLSPRAALHALLAWLAHWLASVSKKAAYLVPESAFELQQNNLHWPETLICVRAEDCQYWIFSGQKTSLKLTRTTIIWQSYITKQNKIGYQVTCQPTGLFFLYQVDVRMKTTSGTGNTMSPPHAWSVSLCLREKEQHLSSHSVLTTH